MKRNTFVAVLVNIALTLTLFAQTTFAQDDLRTIEKLSWRTEPIKVVKIKTKNKTVEFGKEFSEEDDWLRGLTVTVKNLSNKAIARIELQLAFPRPGGGTREKPNYMVGMVYGREPDISVSEELRLVLPDETVEVKLLEVNLPGIKEDLANLGYAMPISSARISVRSVTFVDGSEWSGDDVLYPNPNKPGEKINPKRPVNLEGSGRSTSQPKQ